MCHLRCLEVLRTQPENHLATEVTFELPGLILGDLELKAGVDHIKPSLLPGQPDREEVHRRAAHEPGDEHGHRVIVDRLGVIILLHHPVPHYRHPIPQGHCLRLIVGHINGGGLQLLV